MIDSQQPMGEFTDWYSNRCPMARGWVELVAVGHEKAPGWVLARQTTYLRDHFYLLLRQV